MATATERQIDFFNPPGGNRKGSRVASRFDVSLPDGSSVATKDISDGGACLVSPEPLEFDEVAISILLPLKPITLKVSRVWSRWDSNRGEFLCGVKFLDLSKENLSSIRENLENRPVVEGHEPPSKVKRFFYNALSFQWNPEKEIDWNAPLGLDEAHCKAVADILSPIIIGEYSAFDGIPPRILSFKNYEIKQYLAAQLVDETRHAEAFELYLARIHGKKQYRKNLRNIHILRFFNELKKLEDLDEWIAGLYLTEIMSHVLLSAYAQQVQCDLTQRLFKLILSDEARHISFANYYLKEILKKASDSEREFMTKIPERILKLTEGMVHSYGEAGRTFGVDAEKLFIQIQREFKARYTQSVMKTDDPAS